MAVCAWYVQRCRIYVGAKMMFPAWTRMGAEVMEVFGGLNNICYVFSGSLPLDTKTAEQYHKSQTCNPYLQPSSSMFTLRHPVATTPSPFHK